MWTAISARRLRAGCPGGGTLAAPAAISVSLFHRFMLVAASVPLFHPMRGAPAPGRDRRRPSRFTYARVARGRETRNMLCFLHDRRVFHCFIEFAQRGARGPEPALAGNHLAGDREAMIRDADPGRAPVHTTIRAQPRADASSREGDATYSTYRCRWPRIPKCPGGFRRPTWRREPQPAPGRSESPFPVCPADSRAGAGCA